MKIERKLIFSVSKNLGELPKDPPKIKIFVMPFEIIKALNAPLSCF